MKSLLTIFFLIFSNNIIFAQWINQGYPQAPYILSFDSKFLNSNTGYLVGSSSKVIKTTNSGSIWVSSATGISLALDAVDFLNESTGIALGSNSSSSTCYKTTNGGISWIQKVMPYTKLFTQINFISQSSLICIGDSGLVLKSTNAGDNWFLIPTPTNQFLTCMKCLDSNNFIVIGNHGGLLKTTNGGSNWDLLTIGTPISFSSISFPSSFIGFLGSSSGSLLLRTTNGGLFWSTVNLPMNFLEGITSISFPSLNTGYLTSYYNIGNGYQEVILKSTNSGINWFSVTSTNFLSPLYTSYFVSNDIGWVAGDGGLILKTTNGGLTFINGNGEVVSDYKLEQNYPNPFNPNTKITYELKFTNYVILNVYDVNGKLVKELVNKKQNAGNYEINFSGDGLSSGVYYYSLIVDGVTIDTKKAILLK